MTDDVRNLREPQHGLVLHVRDRAAWDVVEYVRQFHRLGDGLEVAVQPFLAGLVVVRHDREARVRTRFLRVLGKLYRLAGGIAPGAGDDRHPSGGMIDRGLDEQIVLVKVHRG